MTQTPHDLLEELCAGADPRRQRSLRVLHAVCEEQRARGSADYSLAIIGTLSGKNGGPAERALRNPPGAPYRRLIECHRAASGVAPKTKRSAPDSESLLDGIRDPAQRARIQLLRDELTAVRRRLQLTQQVANASAVITLTAATTGDAGMPVATPGRHAAVDLLPIERDALRSALEASRLKSLGLSIDQRGRIVLADGRAAFPIGFATALTKLAAAFGAEQPAPA